MADEQGIAAARPVAKRKRAPKRWTAARQRAFLEALAQTSNVAASERKAKMPVGSAYRERRRSADFAAQWADALAEGYMRLEHLMLERAMGGVVRRVAKKEDGQETVEFSDRMGMALLAAHRATVTGRAAGRSAPAAVTAVQGIAERMAAKLADMRDRAGFPDGADNDA